MAKPTWLAHHHKENDMNPQFPPSSQNVQPAHNNRVWWLYIALLIAAALFVALAGRGGSVQPTSAAPDTRALPVINNHLYVPCSVSSCDPAPVINNHLYIPCSVSSCDPAPVINNHLYVPCSVSSCDPTPAINNHLDPNINAAVERQAERVHAVQA
jgi:hypothetical protein